MGRDLTGHRHVVESLVLRRTDVADGLGDVHDVGHLGRAVRDRAEHGNRAEAHQREHGDDKLRNVRQLDNDPLPRPQAAQPESGRHAIHAPVQVRVRDAGAVMDERGPRPVLQGPAAQQVVQRAATPVPGCPVAVDELLGPGSAAVEHGCHSLLSVPVSEPGSVRVVSRRKGARGGTAGIPTHRPRCEPGEQPAALTSASQSTNTLMCNALSRRRALSSLGRRSNERH